jgi:hypothetical protein
MSSSGPSAELWNDYLLILAVIYRRVEGFPDIPYPPQPYSLTCPQVRKTVEAETNKTKI